MRHPIMGIIQTDYGVKQPYSFTATPQISLPEKTALMNLCRQDVTCYMREEQKGYSVVTLGQLVNTIVPMMDRSIFMPELKEKKENANYYGGYEG